MVIFLLFSSFFRSNLTEKFICQQFTFYLTQPTFALHLILCLDRCDTIFASITNDPEHWCFLFSSLLSSTPIFFQTNRSWFRFFWAMPPLWPSWQQVKPMSYCKFTFLHFERFTRWKFRSMKTDDVYTRV